MVKRTRNKELLKRLDKLQSMVITKATEVVIIDFETWFKSKEKGKFSDYIRRTLANKPDDITVIIDDMLLETSMYLPCELIYDSPKDVIKKFVKAASESDEIQFMKMFIELFEEAFDLHDVPDREYFMTTPTLNFLHNALGDGTRFLTDEEARQQYYERELWSSALSFDTCSEVFTEAGNLFYKDFLDHFKLLSVEELVERYKDQKFFKMIRSHTCETQK